MNLCTSVFADVCSIGLYKRIVNADTQSIRIANADGQGNIIIVKMKWILLVKKRKLLLIKRYLKSPCILFSLPLLYIYPN